jgi:MFS family permease
MGVFGLSLGLFSPVVTSLVSFEAEPRERGAVMGAFNAASSAGRIVGPAMSGPVYFNVGHSAPFVLSAAMTAIAGVLLIRAHGARPARGSGESRASG